MNFLYLLKTETLSLQNKRTRISDTSTCTHQQLKPADSSPGSLPLEIDILIRTQDYWNFIGVQQARDASGPAIAYSKMGNILSGALGDFLIFSSHKIKEKKTLHLYGFTQRSIHQTSGIKTNQRLKTIKGC